MKLRLHLLLVEDSPDDAKLILRELERSGYEVVHTVVTNADEMRSALTRQDWDVILCDYALPQFSGTAALQLVKELGIETPFIFVSGTIGEETAVGAMRSGAQDYVMKDKLARLAPAIGRELSEAATRREAKRADAAMRESEHKYRHLFEALSDAAFLIAESSGQIIDTNAQGEILLGRERSKILGTHHSRLQPPPDAGTTPPAEPREDDIQRNTDFDTQVLRSDGTIIPVHVSTSKIELHGRPFILALLRDITERKRSEEALRASEERFRQLAENIDEVFWLTDAARREMIYVSPAYARIWGRSCESLYAAPQSWLEAVHVHDHTRVDEALPLQAAGSYDLEYRIVRADGTMRWIHERAFPIKDAKGTVYRIAGVAEDITTRRQLEEQFRQSQKMEAVGQLASGIAHDFNNLLTVIQMQACLLLDEGRTESEIQPGIQQIMGAAKRASDLTRQLLTFSRRQVKEARDLDLSETVGTMTKLVRRILGEHISLETRFASGLPLVHADPGMMEQVLMNLLVNARDAMPEGGRLLLTLDCVTIDADYVATHASARPGRHVCLSVSDTGSGIAPENRSRIFEPFFTTKELGKGTGLGLATVFGIVQQHQGWIELESEVGQGTTFRIYLPVLERAPKLAATEVSAPSIRGGSETILLVEDEPPVRTVSGAALRRSGYNVIEAGSAAEALEQWKALDGKLDLLLTDIIMPGGVSGQQLAEELRRQRPTLKIIYTSGYSDDVIRRQLRFEPGKNHLPKPYSLRDLTAIVRQRLDQP